jgi:rubrerythrin
MKNLKNSTMRTVTGFALAGMLGALIYAVVVGARTNAGPLSASQPPVSEQTQQNLLTAMHGEAFAFVKYMLYAEHARRTGHPELAALFERTAHTERFEHFAEEAQLLGLVGSNEDNLRDAIKGESYEVQTMYREFAEQALAAGDGAAANRFSEIRNDEMKHRDAYKAAFQELDKESAQLN